MKLLTAAILCLAVFAVGIGATVKYCETREAVYDDPMDDLTKRTMGHMRELIATLKADDGPTSNLLHEYADYLEQTHIRKQHIQRPIEAAEAYIEWTGYLHDD